VRLTCTFVSSRERCGLAGLCQSAESSPNSSTTR